MLRRRGLPSARSVPWPLGHERATFPHKRSSASLYADERYCLELTRREARNFYWGFIALPRDQRTAIYALYSFARQVDDDVDLNGKLGVSSPGRRFDFHRERLERCFAGSADDPVMRVLAAVVRRYGIPREELEALIRGVEMDLQVRRYESWQELESYCRLVASVIGRMCVRIFGFTDPVALARADELGLAMQLANILRDVREDLSLGRIYLPLEELRRFGVEEQALMRGEPGVGWEPLVGYEVRRARQLFESGLRVTEVIPRRAAACVLTMAGIYRALVDEIARDPGLPLRCRASLGRREKLAVMFRSWLQAM